MVIFGEVDFYPIFHLGKIHPESCATTSDINLHILKYNWAKFHTLFTIGTIDSNSKSYVLY